MTGAAAGTPASGGEYVFYIPEGKWKTHFSSLLFSADVPATVMEVSLVGTLILVAAMFPRPSTAAGHSFIPTVLYTFSLGISWTAANRASNIYIYKGHQYLHLL